MGLRLLSPGGPQNNRRRECVERPGAPSSPALSRERGGARSGTAVATAPTNLYPKWARRKDDRPGAGANPARDSVVQAPSPGRRVPGKRGPVAVPLRLQTKPAPLHALARIAVWPLQVGPPPMAEGEEDRWPALPALDAMAAPHALRTPDGWEWEHVLAGRQRTYVRHLEERGRLLLLRLAVAVTPRLLLRAWHVRHAREAGLGAFELRARPQRPRKPRKGLSLERGRARSDGRRRGRDESDQQEAESETYLGSKSSFPFGSCHTGSLATTGGMGILGGPAPPPASLKGWGSRFGRHVPG